MGGGGSDPFTKWELLGALAIMAGMVGVLVYLLPRELFVVFAAVASMVLVYYGASVLIATYSRDLPDWMGALPVLFTVLAPVTVTAVLLFSFSVTVSMVMLVVVVALLTVFVYYWFVVPLALYQKIEEQNRPEDLGQLPTVNVLVPAYNEEAYVGECIDAVLSSAYPTDLLEVIVVDDGSTDGTLAEAREHATESVTVLTKDNGGKHSALNCALDHATSDIVVTVDADSIVAPDAIHELVRTFEAKPEAGAVAGNVKVSNRGSFVTNVQALEYIIGINTFRRAFDLLGVVTVVPGCLGGFRREVLEEIGRYSPDTLTEDFDATIEVLKRGERIHHSNALVYTEAPETWRDLYRQRLRWFRGNLQTIGKHWRVFVDAEFGLLHRVAFPYVLFSMSVLPALGFAILGIIVWTLLLGNYGAVLGMFVFFVALQVLLSLLAISIDDDDLRLARYAPLSVVGYKQFLDAVLTKSILDVLSGSTLSWTSARRRRHRTREDPSRERSRED